MKAARQGFHAKPENAGDFVEMQAQEVFHLGAGNEDGDAIGESDDDGARDELDGRAQACDSHDDEENSGHDGAHEKAVYTVCRDDAGDYNDEGSGGPADLSLRSAEGRDEESGDDRAINAGLRREAGGNGEGHGQRQGYEADRDAGDYIEKKFVAVIAAETEDGLRKPIVVQESTRHFRIMAGSGDIG